MRPVLEVRKPKEKKRTRREHVRMYSIERIEELKAGKREAYTLFRHLCASVPTPLDVLLAKEAAHASEVQEAA